MVRVEKTHAHLAVPAANERFGWTVLVSGDYAYVSAVRCNWFKGAAYVSHKDAGGTDNWGQIGDNNAIGGEAEDGFGYALAASGKFMAASAYLDDIGGRVDQGTIYFFKGENCPDAPRPEDIVFSKPHALAVAPSVKCWPNPFRDELTFEMGKLEIGKPKSWTRPVVWRCAWSCLQGRAATRCGRTSSAPGHTSCKSPRRLAYRSSRWCWSDKFWGQPKMTANTIPPPDASPAELFRLPAFSLSHLRRRRPFFSISFADASPALPRPKKG